MKRWGDRLSQNLAELSAKKDEVKPGLTLQVQAGSDFAPVSSDAQVPWGLGRLFGASKSPSSPQGHTPPSRFALLSDVYFPQLLMPFEGTSFFFFFCLSRADVPPSGWLLASLH